jgi:hypothetical protein
MLLAAPDLPGSGHAELPDGGQDDYCGCLLSMTKART